MRLKEGVTLEGIRPEIEKVLPLIERCYHDFGYEFMITCTTGNHPDDDPHTHGFAVDSRLHGIPVDTQWILRDNIAKICGPNYYAKLEDPGGSNEHIHTQYRRDLWRAIVEKESHE
jgi:hypothetical protein